MTPRRMPFAFTTGLANLVLMLTTVILVTASGCSNGNRAPVPGAPDSGTEVLGTLIALKDDRPVDGGFDLTLQTEKGARELVRVPSMFIAPPRDSVAAMHEVVTAAKLGDILRARGTRDEDGALRAQVLELVPR